MRMAFETPALVRGLGLISPWSHASGDTQGLMYRLFRLAEAGNMGAHADLLLGYSFPEAFVAPHPTEIEQFHSLLLEQQAWAVAHAWVACLACNLHAEIARIKAPSLIIGGLKDLLAPPYMARGVAEGLSEVELAIWEDAGPIVDRRGSPEWAGHS
jgi:pimeloyl-ACP methyl ester carboxylesterase